MPFYQTRRHSRTLDVAQRRRTSTHSDVSRALTPSARRRCALQIEQLFALVARWLEAAVLVEAEDRLDDGIRFVDDAHQVDVVLADHPFGGHRVRQPVEQSLPERAPDEDDRDAPALARLHEREALG